MWIKLGRERADAEEERGRREEGGAKASFTAHIQLCLTFRRMDGRREGREGKEGQELQSVIVGAMSGVWTGRKGVGLIYRMVRMHMYTYMNVSLGVLNWGNPEEGIAYKTGKRMEEERVW